MSGDGRVTQCGTVAGYLRHIWAETPQCDNCRLAWNMLSGRPPKFARSQLEQERRAAR